MDDVKLIRPEERYAGEIADYRREFLDAGSSMDGTGSLKTVEDVREYIEDCRRGEREETVKPGLVPATQWMLVRESDDRVLGMLQLRHRLNDYLERFGGHIGYSVRLSERRRGYAREILRLGLEECRALGLERVLITCEDGNEGSERTIRANGGVYENTVYEAEEKRSVKRFWIVL